MLKLENFDALRLFIASPEMILSWSHGEVTKPETINYRTLKPERDGLFCERIFGPTKDWECHCGKYKRYRYKGIICDKCGVEVTRSKVRRERMGHIKLASPVSHVWYFKGIPSRMGLLLDISPRNLEKVLYYINYIITNVDDDARSALLAKLTPETDERVTHYAENKQTQRTEDRRTLSLQIQGIENRLHDDIHRLENSKKAKFEALDASLAALDEQIHATEGKKAPAAMFITDGVENGEVAPKGAVMNNALLNTIEDAISSWKARLDEEHAAAVSKLEETTAAELSSHRESLAKMPEEVGEEPEDVEALKKIQEQIEQDRIDLESLTPKMLLSEMQYRDYVERFGKVFKASTGAAAVRELLSKVNLDEEGRTLREESTTTTGQRRQKAIKRLRVVEAFRKSETEPAWMIMDTLPVIPPELRPMVQLDGGRFATSDLNDLYRRVINRNNRLKRLLELGAPDIIVRNEKRMLQEAVDALIDNGRRGRAVTGTGNRKLKSLSDMLKGKQGRFRQNLLGKRVDYSGRSVIVVGPELKLHECGLPKAMALELFKPFVMRELVNRNYTQNIKSAKRMVERVRPEVWDVLDDVIKEHPVLLNRAPTLHRLGIQAFMPTLVEGQAIQIHPMVCKAFNADFDGDQMAVHVPLFGGAIAEAKNLMMSSHNILNASDGRPVVLPSQDIVLGCYYLTQEEDDRPAEGSDEYRALPVYANTSEVLLAYDKKVIGVHDWLRVRVPKKWLVARQSSDPTPEGTAIIVTTPGKTIFNSVLPLGELGSFADIPCLTYYHDVMDGKKLGKLVKDCYDLHGNEFTATVANAIKQIGFHYATVAGITVSAMDIKTPAKKADFLDAAEKSVELVDLQFRRGLITDDERYQKTIEIWTKATEDITKLTMESFDRFHSILMMSQSGARGSVQQIRQIAGIRGLMADPTGRIIDLPIRANFSEGLTVLEYFISTHGARKGLADTALRTADAGYLTRRLVDVSQDVIVRHEDCGTTSGIWIDLVDPEVGERVVERFAGRIAAQDVELDGKVIVQAGTEITDDLAAHLASIGHSVLRIKVRSPMTCRAHEGICRLCYGRNLATGKLVEIGEAVGVIAAQSIGEPGTQLTMRTFHTGGVATGGSDITQGLPRVEELFEARIPKGRAIISEIDGNVELIRSDTRVTKVRVASHEEFTTTYSFEKGASLRVENGAAVVDGQELFHSADRDAVVRSRYSGTAKVTKDAVIVSTVEEESREYAVPASSKLRVADGQHIQAGERITEGSINPQELLLIRGRDEVQNYLVREVQHVYRSQGVDINDKHIEVIVRQMMRKVRIDHSGDTELLPGEIVSHFEWEEANAKALSEGGEPAIASTVLLGLIKAALNTTSWLSAASFQETTRVLTEAAISGKIDRLRGLKENIIIGKLIPAGTGMDYYKRLKEETARLAAEGIGEPEAVPAGVDGELPTPAEADGGSEEGSPVGTI
ncbi:MAG: DNA-directed RNA polymerase subunit beta' [Candidatus Dormibacteria bacterium]